MRCWPLRPGRCGGVRLCAQPAPGVSSPGSSYRSATAATVEKIGVFVDAALEEIVSTVEACGLTGVQLHFDADSELPARLHQRLGPELRILRVVHFGWESSEPQTARIADYAQSPHVDAVLVDSRTAMAVGAPALPSTGLRRARLSSRMQEHAS